MTKSKQRRICVPYQLNLNTQSPVYKDDFNREYMSGKIINHGD